MYCEWNENGNKCCFSSVTRCISAVHGTIFPADTKEKGNQKRGGQHDGKIKVKGTFYATTGMGNDSASNGVLNPLKKVLAVLCLKLQIVNSPQNTHTHFSPLPCVAFSFFFFSISWGNITLPSVASSWQHLHLVTLVNYVVYLR